MPEGLDHINGNPADNRIKNLREATQSQNNGNRKKQKNCSSIYKGVCWNNAVDKWLVQIAIEGKGKYLGHFINERDAGLAYNIAAKKHFGKFALLNKI